MQKINSLASAYLHIPFCKSICSYCDFCKNYYDKNIVKSYLEALKCEINKNYKGGTLKTLYIGGGTPSCLSLDELSFLLDITDQFLLDNNYEFTFECNYEDINDELLSTLKKHGVNRLSIGIETFNQKFSVILNRQVNKAEMFSKIDLSKKYFNNINLDLMYALPGEKKLDLKEDIENFIKMDVQHLSIYALIIEEHTKLYIDKTIETSDDVQAEMYDFIVEELSKQGYNHYEISNFSKPGFESKHNLTCWNNEQYYGFGVGASGFISNVRYDNTRNVKKYILGKYRYQESSLTKETMMLDELMLGLRKNVGINYLFFKNKYGVSLKDAFDVDELINEGLLIENKDNIYIPENMLFVSNEIIIRVLNNYNLNKEVI